MATRTFFRDCQEWEWFPRRFDPSRALAVPRSVSALIGTDPRVIADDVWAKLLWAGLNLEAATCRAPQPQLLPDGAHPRGHPDLAVLRPAQRRDRPAAGRLHPLAARRLPDPGDSREVLARDAVCLLDVPVHKTGTAFTKPVDPLLGQAIEAWQALRPAQPRRLDRKTSEHVDLLFAVRAQPVAKTYINRTIIPVLCRKAGVPAADVRGKITSHRARSTIASQLYNAKEPMTLFELQAWLGHRTPTTTQHYAKITPNTLTKAYTDAGYFARNVRTIEVLVDRDAVASGAAAAGEPWQHYDLGHGCAPTPSSSSARTAWPAPNATSTPRRTRARRSCSKPRTTCSGCSGDDPAHRRRAAAVDDGQAALDKLLGRLADRTLGM
jgi:hypothetical protein